MADRYWVNSTHAEDIASGRLFEPQGWAEGVDPDHPYDAAKIAAGTLIPETAPPVPRATEPAIEKATELNIDLSTVVGTGAGGQIKVSDVESAAQVQPNEEGSN
jgi:pyruvate/2-oxoglutarate dehydrogenase complex dihydrolipoamide acyltransferase (E2) component